ncbi:hypothetical protein ACLKA6_006610 [Drosophila palustris]
MEDTDNILYLCSNCCRRCPWRDLSPEEHRCIRCRLPHQGCAICDRKFEPSNRMELHCKRCKFHMVNQEPTTPPLALDLELNVNMDAEPDLFEPPRELSMSQRWKDIKSATGIQDGYLMN